MGSQATRDSDGVLFTRAGLEIGVAATKTFMSQVTAMYLLALRLGQLRGTIDLEENEKVLKSLKEIPRKLEQFLSQIRLITDEVSRQHCNASFFLYIGRHIGLPVAL